MPCGSKAANSACSNGRTGNRLLNRISPWLEMGKNVPARNTSGSTTRLTIAGAASAFGMAAVMATPSDANVTAPSASTTSNHPMWSGALSL